MKFRCTHAVVVAGALAGGTLAGYLLPRPHVRLVAVQPSAVTELCVSESNDLRNELFAPPTAFEIPLEEFELRVNRAVHEPRLFLRQQALFEIRRGIRLADLPHALTLLSKHLEPDTAELCAYLAGRLTETDPLAALAWVRSLVPSTLRDRSLRLVLAEWTVTDSVAALDWVRSLPASAERSLACATVLDTVAALDPERGMNLLGEMGGVSDDEGNLKAVVLKRWAEKDPAAAAAMASSMEGLSADIYAEIASQWVTRDANAAVEWAKSLPSSQTRSRVLERLVGTWAERDPWQAAALALSQPSGELRSDMLDSVGARWGSSDPAAAVEWASDLPGPERKRVMDQVLADWTRSDSAAAAEYALSLSEGPRQLEALAAVGGAWASQDPEGVVHWTRSLPSSVRADVVRSTIKGLVEQDPRLASEVVMSVDSEAQGSLTKDVATAWARQDLAGATAWLEELPAGDLKKSAVGGLLEEWAANEPAEAADYLVRTVPSNDVWTADLFSDLARQWGETSAEEAVKWVEEVPDGPGKGKALFGLVGGWAAAAPEEAAAYAAQIPDLATSHAASVYVARVWAASDPVSAGTWVESFPEGKARLDAIGAVANTWSQQDGGAAVAWLEPLCDINQMGRRLDLAFILWFNQDWDRAQAWIQRSSLPPATKQMWLSRPRR